LKLRAGIVNMRGMRLALAFVATDFLVAGAADALLARLTPYFPGLPIMLVAQDAGGRRAYASFDTAALLAELDLSNMKACEIDLDLPAPDMRALPF
jgi:hypothetical protein